MGEVYARIEVVLREPKGSREGVAQKVGDGNVASSQVGGKPGSGVSALADASRSSW